LNVRNFFGAALFDGNVLAVGNRQIEAQDRRFVDGYGIARLRVADLIAGNIEPGHTDEQDRRRPFVDHRHIAPGIVDVRTRPGGHELSIGIEDKEAAIALGARRAIGARRAADDHPAGLEHGHGRAQADAAGTLRKLLRQAGEQCRLLGGGGVIDDRAAGALQVRHIVEIGHQHVALLDLAGRDRRDDHGIGVEVTIVRHRRGPGDMSVNGFEETLIRGLGAWSQQQRRRDQRGQGRKDPRSASPRRALHRRDPCRHRPMLR
jgi:hypothetical protein